MEGRRGDGGRTTLGWLGRCLLRWPVGVLAGAAYLAVVELLGAETWGMLAYLDTTLGFVWFGMPFHLGVLAWRSGRPSYRTWAVATSWLLFLPFVTVLLAGWPEHASPSLLVAALTFGALVPERPVA